MEAMLKKELSGISSEEKSKRIRLCKHDTACCMSSHHFCYSISLFWARARPWVTLIYSILHQSITASRSNQNGRPLIKTYTEISKMSFQVRPLR